MENVSNLKTVRAMNSQEVSTKRFNNSIDNGVYLTIKEIVFSFQETNKIPVNKHDVKMDYILTEKGLN